MISIKVGKHTYRSIAEACREEKSPVPEITVRWRLKNGWSPEQAIREPRVPKRIRRKFKDLRKAM